MSLHTEYHLLPSGQEIKISVSFNKDPYRAPVGYRACVLPVKRTKREGYTMEESGAFTGFNDTLIHVNRQSSKRLNLAIDSLKARIPDYLKHEMFSNL